MNRIKWLRKSKNLSQTELADRLNVTQTSVSQWETGKTFPDMRQAIQIADFFETTTDFVLGRVVDKPAQKKSPPAAIDTAEALKFLLTSVVGHEPTVKEVMAFSSMVDGLARLLEDSRNNGVDGNMVGSG